SPNVKFYSVLLEFLFLYCIEDLFCSMVVPVEMEGFRPVERRYAESTIASDISKIVDSMAQKNFVNFLLNRKEKKSNSQTIMRHKMREQVTSKSLGKVDLSGQ
uniref:Gastric inhibitory polypeptide n=1 Tax=Erpetoichthys calabaricus TaxID=27687 RepID=A0A8C4TL14_ERPCA